MSEKRKTSTRYGREPRRKRHNSSPPPPTGPAPAPVIEVEDDLPLKLKNGLPLPTSLDPQVPNLSSSSFQDISTSGVLAASIERSRQKWLTDGVFEKYWTKPTKKKPQVEAQNPAKDSMSRLGGCQVIIEPHVFETTLHVVRETQHAVVAPISPAVQAIPSPASAAYGSPYGAVSPPLHHHGAPMASTSVEPRPQSRFNNTQPQLPPFQEGFARFEPQGPLPPIPPSFASSRSIAPSSPQLPPLFQHNRSKSPVQDPQASPDPVIQMLAAQAAEDHDLKSLMRIVAKGDASSEQLRKFQAQIDEFTKIVSMHKVQVPPAENSGKEKHEDLGGAPMSCNNIHQAPRPPVQPPLAPFQPRGVVKSERPAYHPPIQQTPKHLVQTTQRQDVRAIVFEFVGGNGDRYLFPKYSILEYLPGNTQALASFLVIRTGATANSGSYGANASYYQPVTIRLRLGSHLHSPKIFDVLPKGVAPPEEVRKHMNDIMDKMKPAELVHLVTQLPRTHEVTPSNIPEPSKELDHEILRRTYSPPNTLLPLRPAAHL